MPSLALFPCPEEPYLQRLVFAPCLLLTFPRSSFLKPLFLTALPYAKAHWLFFLYLDARTLSSWRDLLALLAYPPFRVSAGKMMPV